MKKLLSLILALVMVLALSVTAMASAEPAGEASGETSVEVTNEGFGSYVSYLRKYIAECDDPQFDDGAKDMALADLDAVEIGVDVHAFPFDMFGEIWGAMSYEEFMTSQAEGSAEPESKEQFDAYLSYVRDYMENYDGAGAKEGFDEASKTMALGELDNVAYPASVNGFPFVMFVNEFGALSYADFIAASGEPSGEASGYDGYVEYLDEYIRENVEADYVDMALSDLYAATEAQAVAEEFPFEMFTGAHGAMTYAQWQAANGQ